MRTCPRLSALLLAAGFAVTSRAEVTVVDRPETRTETALYPSNRPPLLPSALIKLPVGSVRPEGWLRRRLELQAEGFHGRLTEISRFLKKENNSWLDPQGQGEHGWEEVPYWLKGFGDCAYLLGDEEQIAEAMVWIEGALASQREDGFFGPRGQGARSTVQSTEGKYDLWPNMVMLNGLQTYYEWSGDPRVIELMRRYFRWELTVPDEDFLPPYWQQQRAANNLASVHWLYNRTGEPWLLELAEKIHRNTAAWTEGIASWHNVNLAQAFDSPAIFYPQSKAPDHLKAAYRNFDTVRAMYGQVPGGLFGSDENCRPGYDDPRQAVETCGMVEFLDSAESLLAITGDPLWADRGEDVAFNMLPAALTADMKGLRYLTAPNQAVSDKRNHAPGIENAGPMFEMNPNIHRCCQHNFGHGWPYLAEHLWMATTDRGLALVFPLASRVEAKVGPDEGTEVAIETRTRYPFEEALEIVIHTPEAVRFPLYLRVPGWCDGATLTLNGEAQEAATRPLSYLRVDREWRDGDIVRLVLPMSVTLRTWEKNHGSVSVDRGPLTYSLLIGEEFVRSGGTDAWPAYEILPTTPWNYGLILAADDPAGSFTVEERSWPDTNDPWTPEAVPIRLSARGKRIPEWTLDAYGLVAPLQDSPVRSDEPIEDLTLIPMGAARLRISAFPVIGDGPNAHRWTPPPAEPPR